ncbi:MAG: LemA family protein, partial [Candidatus Woesearchaeota archaeon]
KSDELVNERWANVQTAYQRRADLIPNLVEVVKGFAAQEQEVFLGVTQARTQWLNSKSGSIEAQMKASQEFDSAFARLLVTVENYPQIKSNENFLSLQDELAGTENRIKVERDLYNNAVRQYNVKVRTFPRNLVAKMFGFELRTMFEAQEGTENAPRVSFS